MMEYEVARQHYGDRMYMPGETREAREDEVRHLVQAGVLRVKTKVEPPHKTKGKK